jgi:hypothetical protein
MHRIHRHHKVAVLVVVVVEQADSLHKLMPTKMVPSIKLNFQIGSVAVQLVELD